MALGDLNADGRIDIAAADAGLNCVACLYAQAAGGYGDGACQEFCEYTGLSLTQRSPSCLPTAYGLLPVVALVASSGQWQPPVHYDR